MFAGLPGIGVGTLFYILAALLMPVTEIARLIRGTSSLARWRRIIVQWWYSAGVIMSVMLADRILLWIFADAAPKSMNPARWLHESLILRAPRSIMAAPITASLLLVVGVVLAVELTSLARRVTAPREPAQVESPLADSTLQPQP